MKGSVGVSTKGGGKVGLGFNIGDKGIRVEVIYSTTRIKMMIAVIKGLQDYSTASYSLLLIIHIMLTIMITIMKMTVTRKVIHIRI